MTRKSFLLLLPITFLFLGLSLPGCFQSKQAGIWRSDDGGETWAFKVKIDEKSSIAALNILKTVFDPADPQIIYLGSEGKGMYVSHNNGDTWARTKIAIGDVWDIAIDSDDPKIMYVSVFSGGAGRLYATRDGGENWEMVFADAIAGQPLYNIIIDWYNHNNIIINTGWGGILKSEDQGKTWTKLAELTAKTGRLQMDEQDSRMMWYVTSTEGIFESEDGGVSWTEIALEGLKPFKGGSGIYQLERDKRNNTFYLATSYGLLLSQDGGRTWTPMKTLTPSASLPIVAVAVNSQNQEELFFVAGNTVFKSVNEGESWQVRKMYAAEAIRIIRYHPVNPNIIYLGLRAVKK